MPFQDEDVITSRSGGPSHNDLWTQGGSFLHFHFTFLWLRHCEWLYSNYRSSVITITAFSFRTAVVLNSYTKQTSNANERWHNMIRQNVSRWQKQTSAENLLVKRIMISVCKLFPGGARLCFLHRRLIHVWMYWSWAAVGIMQSKVSHPKCSGLLFWEAHSETTVGGKSWLLSSVGKVFVLAPGATASAAGVQWWRPPPRLAPPPHLRRALEYKY